MSRIRDWGLKYLNVWLALIVGIVLGMSLFSLLLQAPPGLENWLSAIGTILAVVVSLYLANRPKKKGMLQINDSSLTIQYGLKDLEEHGRTNAFNIKLNFFVSNPGETDILIKEVAVQLTEFVNPKFFDIYEASSDEALLKAGEVRYMDLDFPLEKLIDETFQDLLLSPILDYGVKAYLKISSFNSEDITLMINRKEELIY